MQRGERAVEISAYGSISLALSFSFFPFQSSIARLADGVLAHERFAFLP